MRSVPPMRRQLVEQPPLQQDSSLGTSGSQTQSQGVTLAACVGKVCQSGNGLFHVAENVVRKRAVLSAPLLILKGSALEMRLQLQPLPKGLLGQISPSLRLWPWRALQSNHHWTSRSNPTHGTFSRKWERRNWIAWRKIPTWKPLIGLQNARPSRRHVGNLLSWQVENASKVLEPYVLRNCMGTQATLKGREHQGTSGKFDGQEIHPRYA